MVLIGAILAIIFFDIAFLLHARSSNQTLVSNAPRNASMVRRPKRQTAKGSALPSWCVSVLVGLAGVVIGRLWAQGVEETPTARTPPPLPCVDAAECASIPADSPCNSRRRLRLCPVSCGLCSSECRRSNSTPLVADGASLEALFARAETFADLSPRRVSSDPPIVVFDRFLTVDEATAISESCARYDRSLAGDAVSSVRTSSQCWCYEECMRDPRVRAVVDRVHDVTQSPEANAEYMQIVRYEPGQFYRRHHDQNSAPETPQGARVLTLFMYLNTPDAGGATRFNDLDLDVQPLVGRAVLWPSVSIRGVDRVEDKTHHEALSVEGGTKHGANIWIHMHDWKTPAARRCPLLFHNTFDHGNRVDDQID